MWSRRHLTATQLLAVLLSFLFQGALRFGAWRGWSAACCHQTLPHECGCRSGAGNVSGQNPGQNQGSCHPVTPVLWRHFAGAGAGRSLLPSEATALAVGWARGGECVRSRHARHRQRLTFTTGIPRAACCTCLLDTPLQRAATCTVGWTLPVVAATTLRHTARSTYTSACTTLSFCCLADALACTGENMAGASHCPRAPGTAGGSAAHNVPERPPPAWPWLRQPRPSARNNKCQSATMGLHCVILWVCGARAQRRCPGWRPQFCGGSTIAPTWPSSLTQLRHTATACGTCQALIRGLVGSLSGPHLQPTPLALRHL